MTAQVMGYLAQCQICPQQAVLTEQVDGWLCPRCEQVAPAEARIAAHTMAAIRPAVESVSSLMAFVLGGGELVDEEPCAASHPAFRDHLCGLPHAHSGDHQSHVLYWPAAPPTDTNEALAGAMVAAAVNDPKRRPQASDEDQDQDWLRKVQG